VLTLSTFAPRRRSYHAHQSVTLFDRCRNNDIGVKDNTSSAHFKLLLVDEDPISRQVLSHFLSSPDHQLSEASSGEQALQSNVENGPFDLILLDIMMTDLCGYTLCQKIRETYPLNKLAVIFVTTKNQPADLAQGFAVGCNDYISNPVVKEVLQARVETQFKLLIINRKFQSKLANTQRQLKQKHHQLTATQQQLVKLQIATQADIFEPLDKSAVPIAQLLQSFVNEMKAKQLDTAQFSLQIESQPHLACDPAHLNQALMHLLSNAINAIIKVGYPGPSGRIIIGCQQQQNKIHIWVKDNGCGLSAKAIEQLLEHRMI
jgi:CheY-like chemotaxis protein